MPAPQAAQGGGTPMDIVPPGIAGTGAPPSAGGGLVDKLRAMLGGGSAPTEKAGGFDLGNFLTDVGAGMGAVDWKDNAFSGFGKGVTAASQSANERDATARARTLQDMQIKDRREDRKFKIEDRAYERQRDQRNFDATQAERADQRKYRQSAEGRAAESHKINMAKSVLEIMKASSPTTLDNLTLDQKLKVNKAISDRIEAEGGDLKAEPEDVARIAESVLVDLGLKSPQAPGAPAAPQGAGTQADPYRVTTRAEAEALPSGSIFVTPDGKMIRKQ